VLFAILEAAKLVSAYKKQKGKMKVTTEGFSE
jgi:hypothetical protein